MVAYQSCDPCTGVYVGSTPRRRGPLQLAEHSSDAAGIVPAVADSFSPISTSTLRSAGLDHDMPVYLVMPSRSYVIRFRTIYAFSRFRDLSFGLPRFRFPYTVICNIFPLASSLSRLCIHVQTCTTHINLFSLRNSAFGYVCLFPDVYISHMI